MVGSNKNYRLENSEIRIVYKQYFSDPSLFYEFWSMLKSSHDLVVNKIESSEELYSQEFDRAISSFFRERKSIFIEFENNAYINLMVTRQKENDLYLMSFYFDYSFSLIESIIEIASMVNGIYYAYLANDTDITWQNETSIDAYKFNRISMRNLKFTIDVFDKKCVDISEHYGRTIYNDGILYVAAYISWLSPEIEKLFNHNKFDYAHAVHSMENGVKKIILFESILVDYEKYRGVQKKFLESISRYSL